MVDQLLAKLFN
ncbi:hypothetical protein H4Q32_000168 [Labeo rohita]|uniref:Uncharacterized protein n=1 Tax=Labeo rohita TaxID=84645 RepID=A0ABQ8LHT1_LABRO|nr:hypothetical protein H4Q32_000168 [Labeo rohita]